MAITEAASKQEVSASTAVGRSRRIQSGGSILMGDERTGLQQSIVGDPGQLRALSGEKRGEMEMSSDR